MQSDRQADDIKGPGITVELGVPLSELGDLTLPDGQAVDEMTLVFPRATCHPGNDCLHVEGAGGGIDLPSAGVRRVMPHVVIDANALVSELGETVAQTIGLALEDAHLAMPESALSVIAGQAIRHAVHRLTWHREQEARIPGVAVQANEQVFLSRMLKFEDAWRTHAPEDPEERGAVLGLIQNTAIAAVRAYEDERGILIIGQTP